MRISVVIPTLNRPRAVESCLDALGAKASPNFRQASRLNEPAVDANSAESKPDLNNVAACRGL
jgi:GT2 family glycosyltransferase